MACQDDSKFSKMMLFQDDSTTCQREPRKGIQAHRGILESYMKGMDVKDTDRFIVLDLVANRRGFQRFFKMKLRAARIPTL